MAETDFDVLVDETSKTIVNHALAKMGAVVSGYRQQVAELEKRLDLSFKEQERLKAELDRYARAGIAPAPRKRGRPPKYSVAPQPAIRTHLKRGPGRPRKTHPELPVAVAKETLTIPVKRGPGRPRKNPLPPAPPTEPVRDASTGYEVQRLDLDEPTPPTPPPSEHE